MANHDSNTADIQPTEDDDRPTEDGIRPNRQPSAQYDVNFADIHPPLDPHQAMVEADRCYFCHDAPCIEACPTGIDIPAFIHKISTGNLRGSARKILEQNIFGGFCARVCPVEVLCEQACVRNTGESKPVAIGALQRHATDHQLENGGPMFARGPDSGKRVAVVGAGPAGLACAHRLAMLGHRVDVYDAARKPGGLNEYGIAAYKVVDNFAQREIEAILAIGGIDVHLNKALGRDLTLEGLRRDHDALFLAIGLAGVNALGLDGDEIEGIGDAVDYIRDLRQAEDLGQLPVGRQVVVIGGGMTAIDIACQSKLLGSEDVTIVYRRGPEHMGASAVERDFAQTTGVKIKYWAKPLRLGCDGGRLSAVEFEYTRLDDGGRLVGTGERFSLAADMLFRAIGQKFEPQALDGAGAVPALDGGRITVDADRRTSLEDVWAGGDCVAGGLDLTVSAVEDGKVAAHAIDRYLRPQAGAGGGAEKAGTDHG